MYYFFSPLLSAARKDHGKGRCVVGGYTIKGGYRSTPYIAYNGGSSDLVDSGTASISAIDGVPDDTLTADGIMSGRSARLNLLVDSSTELPDPRHTFDRLVKKQCYEQDTDSTFFDDFEMKALESCHYYHIGNLFFLHPSQTFTYSLSLILLYFMARMHTFRT